MIDSGEKQLLRDLAKRYAELAASDVNNERKKRARDINDLKPGRPIVLIDEVPWHQMDIDGQLSLVCSDESARQMELHFRRSLFQWEFFQADMMLDDAYYLSKSYNTTGISNEVKEETIAADKNNNIISHHYIDQLETEGDLKIFHKAVVTVDTDKDNERMEKAFDILGDIMPVKLRGNYIYYAPWDEIARLKPLDNILIDMMDRPEFIHKIIKTHVEYKTDELEQMEKLGLFDHNIPTLHCTAAPVSDLPTGDNGTIGFKDIWFRSMAQIFSTVSPDMREEFDLQYTRPLMDRCGLVYYGCCEPLDNFIPYLKKVPNMRKIGVSPWSDVNSCAEQIGSDYVYAHKPNPAFVAGDFDSEAVEKEIEAVVKACIKNNCAYEITLKDISTVSYRPDNLTKWYRTAKRVLDRYYA